MSNTAIKYWVKSGQKHGAISVKKVTILSVVLLSLTFSAALPIVSRAQATDPLPSWNDGAVKQSIIAFVKKVTTQGNSDFVPSAERIATFDNDGTLWVEKPVPTELFFVAFRVHEMAERDSSLRERQPYKALLEKDISYLQQEGEKAFVELLTGAYAGLTQEQFAAEAHRFLETARDPKFGKAYTDLAYPPMLELLAYLRANGFQIWICSGGTVDFMRAFAPQMYGVPPERIIGTELKREAKLQDCKRVIVRLPQLETFNDKDTKPVNIDRNIGLRPIFVAGNVGGEGDLAMMQYSKGRTGASFQLLINHDDAAREFLYGEPGNNSLNTAKTCGFTVVNVKSDWNTVLAFQKTGN